MQKVYDDIICVGPKRGSFAVGPFFRVSVHKDTKADTTAADDDDDDIYIYIYIYILHYLKDRKLWKLWYRIFLITM